MTVRPNVNVTHREADPYSGKTFPCPLCDTELQLRVTRTDKPYCHCDSCGVQLFFRGKHGIQKLKHRLESPHDERGAVLVLYNRLEKLKKQKAELEDRQGLIFRDKDLGHAIDALEAEIESLRFKIQPSILKVPRKS